MNLPRFMDYTQPKRSFVYFLKIMRHPFRSCGQFYCNIKIKRTQKLYKSVIIS